MSFVHDGSDVICDCCLKIWKLINMNNTILDYDVIKESYNVVLLFSGM